MKLRTVKLMCFRSHEQSEFTFGDGVTAIVGPNGSGKSSIFEAVWWALYGVSRTRTQDELVQAGKNAVAVQVVFSYGGNGYTVNRRYERTRQSGGVTSLTFYRHQHSEDLTGATVPDTQRRIADVIGPWDVMVSTSYVGQGEGDRFLRARPSERRDIFARSLAIDERWDDWWARAQGRLKVVQGLMQAASTKIDFAREIVDANAESASGLRQAEAVEQQERERVAAANEALAAASAQLKAAEHEAATARERAARQRELASRAEKLDAEWTDLKRQIVAAELVIADQAQIEAEYERGQAAALEYQSAMASYRRQLAQYRERESQHAALDAIVTGLEARFHGVDSPDAFMVCPTCGRTMDAKGQGSLARLKADLQGQYDSAVAKRDAIPRLAAPTLPELTAPVDTRRRFELDQALNLLPKLRARLADKEQEVIIARREADEAKPGAEADEQAKVTLVSQHAAARAAARNAEDALRAATADVAARQGKQALVDTARATGEEAQEELAKLNAELPAVQIVAQGCSPRGVRQLMADQALAQVETEANRRLAQLNPGYSVHFSTLTESGRETLDVTIGTPQGVRSFESLSGGEGTRVAVAVRLAMGTVAANAHGMPALPSVILDEAFGNQDAAGRDAFVECIADLARTVGQVLVVSHDAEFQQRFDQRIVLA